MGLGNWLRQAIGGSSASVTGPKAPVEQESDQPPVMRRISMHLNSCLEVAGTTTFAKDAVTALANRKGLGERGYYEGQAQLQREPENPVDPQAVAVRIDGDRVGCLPSYAAKELALPAGASEPARYQLHVLRDQKLLAKAYVWLGDGEPAWQFTAQNPPALTSRERINSSHAEKSSMVREALQGGSERAQQFKRGMVDGVHYLELVEPIKQLKREGRLEEALALCYKAIEAAEGDAPGDMPAPWYTEQSAIVHRKLGQKDEEIAVLKRWLDRCPHAHRANSSIAERLGKLEAK
jgi:tetratricopeptide (TPR) repeat protein